MASAKPRSAGGTEIRILDAAERLFAAHGVENVSVRAVLGEAGVNVALAHYHFGSREGLIRAVLERRVRPLDEERVALLEQAQARGSSCSIEDVLRASYAPMLRLLYEQPDFARIVGNLHGSHDRALRLELETMFEGSTRLFSDAIRPLLGPDLTAAQRLCRATFLLGAVVQTLAHFDDVRALSRARGHAVPSLEELLDELVAFGAAGLRAPATQKGQKR